jgi:imidazoleglycerol-phosphate dehydratase
MREISKTRETKETKISLTINLDGKGEYQISTGVNFFNHMLEQFAYHSGFDVALDVKSLDNDSHHLIEDVAITLGSAIKEALSDKKGINRYAKEILPMDEALIMSVIDISGRPFCKVDIDLKDEKTSDFETVLLAHFFNSLAQNIGMSLHIKLLEGYDTHHIIEAAFKATARALKDAVKINPEKINEIPSTKGIL